MGILSKITNQSSDKNSTKGFYFGATEAEGENKAGSSLIEYFEDYLEILNEINNGRFIFIGRKGSGKSAIAKYIKDTSDKESESYASIIRINDINLESIIQREEKVQNIEALVFEWLILVRIIRLIVSNECGKYTEEYRKLSKFLEINSGVVEIDKYQIKEINSHKGGEVKIANLAHAFGGVFKRYFGVTQVKAPFYQVIPALKDIVKKVLDYEVNKELEFWLLFDDLDIDFNVNCSKDQSKVVNLIRIAKEYNNEVFKHNKARVLVFLRDDVSDAICELYTDTAKIFSTYEIKLNWYNHKSYVDNNEDEIPLKKLANKRIEINFKRNNLPYSDNPWDDLFKNEDYNENGYFKSSFKYILDFTFYRPRDLITFLMILSRDNYSFPLSKSSVKAVLKKYISVNITEIKSELNLFFTEKDINKLFQIIFPYVIREQDVSKQKVLELIDANDFVLESNKVFDILIKYSLILFVDNKGLIYFNYRDNSNIGNINAVDLHLTLPKCIYYNYKQLY